MKHSRSDWTLIQRYAEVHTGLQRDLIENKYSDRSEEEKRQREFFLRKEAEATKQLISQVYNPDGSLTDFGRVFLQTA